MAWIRIVDWEEFQHYKDRCPPWIKVHRRQVLDDHRYRSLPDGAQALLVDLWLLASESKNRGRVKDDLKDLEFRLRRAREGIAVNLQRLADVGLVEWKNPHACGTLADASDDLLAGASTLQTRVEERRGEDNGGPPQMQETKAAVRRVLSGEEPPAPRLRKP